MPTTNSHSRSGSWLLMLLALLLVVMSMLLAVGIGAAAISYGDVAALMCRAFGGECELSALNERIIVELRMPRVIMAFLAGAGLSLAGAVLQTVTRNPLADPYLFGISAGAAFGAVIVIASVTAGSVAFSQFSLTFGAFVGSTLSVLLVVSMAGSGIQIERMLLAGVAVSFMFSAGTSLVLYSSDPQAAASLLFWTLGSFTRATWGNLGFPSLVVISSLLLFLAYSRSLRAMLAGDETARSLGVEVNRLRIGMLLLSSLMTATLVANCGGIGFVGLMVPHIVRRLMPRQTEFTLLATALFGGIFMIWVDVLARELMDNNELPVGVITAAIGSVFFLLVLQRRSWSDAR